MDEFRERANQIVIDQSVHGPLEMANFARDQVEMRFRLEAALGNLVDMLGNPHNATESFERVGDLYYQKFHRLRPGKDEAMTSGRDSCSDENHKQFDAWFHAEYETRYDAARALLNPEASS